MLKFRELDWQNIIQLKFIQMYHWKKNTHHRITQMKSPTNATEVLFLFTTVLSPSSWQYSLKETVISLPYRVIVCLVRNERVFMWKMSQKVKYVYRNVVSQGNDDEAQSADIGTAYKDRYIVLPFKTPQNKFNLSVLELELYQKHVLTFLVN